MKKVTTQACRYLFFSSFVFCYEQGDNNKLTTIPKFSIPTYVPPLSSSMVLLQQRRRWQQATIAFFFVFEKKKKAAITCCHCLLLWWCYSKEGNLLPLPFSLYLKRRRK